MGDALEQTQKVMRQEVADHEASDNHLTRSSTTPRSTWCSSLPTQALVTECVVDDTQLINVDSGTVLNGNVTTFRLQDTVQRDSRRALETSRPASR